MSTIKSEKNQYVGIQFAIVCTYLFLYLDQSQGCYERYIESLFNSGSTLPYKEKKRISRVRASVQRPTRHNRVLPKIYSALYGRDTVYCICQDPSNTRVHAHPNKYLKKRKKKEKDSKHDSKGLKGAKKKGKSKRLRIDGGARSHADPESAASTEENRDDVHKDGQEGKRKEKTKRHGPCDTRRTRITHAGGIYLAGQVRRTRGHMTGYEQGRAQQQHRLRTRTTA